MHDDPVIRALDEAARLMREMPPGKLFAMLVEEGIIDKQGRVLRRMPVPPWERDEEDKPADGQAPPAADNGEPTAPGTGP